ncbi:MAG: FAD-binding oxidoreductase [Deltaproteobacteria bacterium]|nr:FAD-binding oxidoreductase [Deltaproteobacteria bacterium]
MRFPDATLEATTPPTIDEISIPASRVSPPASLASAIDVSPLARASHTYGKSFRDVVRGLRRDFGAMPDAVAFPGDEAELVAVLSWCDERRIAAIPYGGGSSVVGGVEARSRDRAAGAVSIDLTRLDRVLEIDRTSRAARIQAGILGPALEDALRPHGLTLRHFPQSFEFSSLGGWIATRSGGHYATVLTHIDEMVECLRVVTPSGTIATRRLPSSGAGPSPDRLFIGSEGILGVITEAWMRVQDRPRFRTSTAVSFADLHAAAEAVRAISQSGLQPTNCRLLDPGEALLSGTSMSGDAVLVVGFESSDHALDPWMARALELCADHGGRFSAESGKTRVDLDGIGDEAVSAWRRAFLRMPYVRDAMVGLGLIAETFETAVTWDRFPEFDARVREATLAAATRLCGAAEVTCRFTHVYPDGPAPYYTVLAPSRLDRQLEQWMEIKCAAAEAILAAGGTITHHHAVGRDHRPWYDRERPDGFAAVLAAAKKTLDPGGILNPGVLIDPA